MKDLHVFVPESYHAGFGDNWACVSYLLGLSEEWKSPVLIGTSGDQWRVERAALWKHMSDHFDTTGSLLFVKHEGTCVIPYLDAYLRPYLPTKPRYQRMLAAKRDVVAYQFDGKSDTEDKNLRPGEEETIIQFLKKQGYQTVDVGHMMPLPKIIETLSVSRFFVGVTSGISHVAFSVGVPMKLILNRRPLNYVMNCYRGQDLDKVGIYDDPEAFMASVGHAGTSFM